MKRRFHALLMCLLVLPVTATAAALNAYAGLDAGYKSGDFDTATEESLYSLSLVLGTLSGRADASVSIPYLVTDSNSGDADSGLGDIVLRAGYLLIEQTKDRPSLHGSLALKLPTASEDEELGTGETDLGGFLTLRQPVAETAHVNVSLGYIMAGDAGRTRYEDVATYSVGVTRNFGRVLGFVSLEGRENVDDASDDPLELHVGAFGATDGRHMLTGDAFVGLTDGGADIGVTLGVVRWF